MTITFRCMHCHKVVKAPDAAAGRRGKCPYCQQSNYIPAPVSEDEILDLAPEDEEYERHRREEVERLLAKERELLAEGAAEVAESRPPLEHREDLASEDLHHFVVNYCLDMANAKLERAAVHVKKLKEFRGAGVQAVDDFLMGTALEPALGKIPPRVLQGFLKQLRQQLR
ncbi:MAG TPA: hypothetical protein VM389_01345 [Phycisphaerae bacterium]|nr:hypothetical protein [Phycisphaerae bacterium]